MDFLTYVNGWLDQYWPRSHNSQKREEQADIIPLAKCASPATVCSSSYVQYESLPRQSLCCRWLAITHTIYLVFSISAWVVSMRSKNDVGGSDLVDYFALFWLILSITDVRPSVLENHAENWDYSSNTHQCLNLTNTGNYVINLPHTKPLSEKRWGGGFNLWELNIFEQHWQHVSWWYRFVLKVSSKAQCG